MSQARTKTTQENPPTRSSESGNHARDIHPADLASPFRTTASVSPRAVSPAAQLRGHFAGLQRTIGNQAVLRMLRSHAIQAKLEVGAVDDPLEQEADRVAEQVMRMPDPTAAIDPQEPHASSKDLARHPTASDHGPLVQRECACGGSCDKCQAEQSDDEHEKARRKPDALQISRVASSAASTGMEVPPIVHEVLSSPGQPLDAETRAFFEPRFGQDLGYVRVHTDAQAAESAKAIDALAYTISHHVGFRTGEYAPHHDAGRTLMAHELTHVIQQSGSRQTKLQRKPSDDEVPASSTSQLPAAQTQGAKTLTIVSWISPDNLPDFSEVDIALTPPSLRALIAVAMILKCTANSRPPRTLRGPEFQSFLGTKEYRAVQQYVLGPRVFQSRQMAGFTAPSKCDCKTIPPCSYLQGEVSPLSYVSPSAHGFTSLLKFRVSATEEAAAIAALPGVPVSLGGMSLDMLPRVPWVWTNAAGIVSPGSTQLLWLVQASAFPTHTIYVDGIQVAEIAQQVAGVLLGPGIRTADKPRQTAVEEEAQRDVPIPAQQDTVRPGGGASGEN